VLARLLTGRWVKRCKGSKEKHGKKYLAKVDMGEHRQQVPPSGTWEVVDVQQGIVITVKRRVAITTYDARGSAGDVIYSPRYPGDRMPVVNVPHELGLEQEPIEGRRH
jgi:hypothetical protein